MANNTEPTKPNNMDQKGGFDFTVDDNSTEAKPKAPSENSGSGTSSSAQSTSTGSATANANASASDSTNPHANAQPQIPEDLAPFVVLCGPPSSGKSMVLKCLSSYLYNSREFRYSIAANRTLLNTDLYQSHCDYFDSIIGDPDTPMPNTVDYLLADIIDNKGNAIVHFLEAPGEDFFSLNNIDEEPRIPFKSYLYKVARSPKGLRKVTYIILLDLDSATSLRKNAALRIKYEQKMEILYHQFVVKHPSRVILLYNKVDIPMNGLWGNASGCTNPDAVRRDGETMYPRLFFQRKFLGWPMDDYTFHPFCTGSYPGDGSYTAPGTEYPAALWADIAKGLW